MDDPKTVLIEAGQILTGVDAEGAAQIVSHGALLVRDGVIAEIGDAVDLKARFPDVPHFGNADHIAMPGFVNAHHHFGLTPLMMGVPFAPLEFWLPQFRGMRRVSDRLDTLYSAIEMLESGTTTVQHIHSGLQGPPDNWDRAADEILSAYGEIGMRSGFCFMIRDQNILSYEPDADVLATLPSDVRQWIAPSLRVTETPMRDYMDFFARKRAQYAVSHPDTVRFNLAPANLHWVSDDALQMIVETAREHGSSIHMHLLETERQAVYARQTFKCSAVEHMAELGCLGPELTIGHGNWVSGRDMDLLAEHQCMVCHNASSGLRLSSGIAPVHAMCDRGIAVALGIDQSNICDDRDMTIEMKLVWALHRGTGLWNQRLETPSILQMASQHGARSAGFEGVTGRLDVGLQADIVLMSSAKLGRPFLDKRTPVSDAILHRGNKDAIDMVFVGGDCVVKEGRVTRIDRDAVMAAIAERLAEPETAQEQENVAMVEKLMPWLMQFHKAHTPEPNVRPYRYNAMV